LNIFEVHRCLDAIQYMKIGMYMLIPSVAVFGLSVLSQIYFVIISSCSLSYYQGDSP
jgi:hypothetical protein